MKSVLRSLLSQEIINNFYHLPVAIFANVVYGFPAKKLKVIGVTGTDGKTTTVNMIYQILKAAGKKVSMISTINSPGLHVTSPDPFKVQQLIKQAVEEGKEYMILEVTSHALDQFRFWGIKFEAGVITNITHEHLDYHKTFENYKNTKLKLLKNAKYAIKPNTSAKFNLNLKIPGSYNLENAYAAMAVAKILKIDEALAKQALENFSGLSGRMEEVKNRRGIKVFIDFAHTPNGLENALKTLRTHARHGKLISLIGCEGFRDVGKRAMMGEVAQKLSDMVIVTAVDPRGQIEVINKQIAQGAKRAGAKEGINFFIINDRQEAIDFAINKLAKKGEVVGIFGKGHETSMNLDGKRERSWSDRKAVEEALNGS